MPNLRYTTAFLIAATVSLTAQAQTAMEHAQHHSTTVAQAHTQTQPATPEERNVLMAEHMTIMHDGMVTMNQMGGMGMGRGGVAARQGMLDQRMDMMHVRDADDDGPDGPSSGDEVRQAS